MKYLDLTLPTATENLACDEALLERAEAGEDGEALRFWEPRTWFIAVGYGNAAATEVNLPLCAAQGVPVLRRITGGGTVVQGPGCLNYALILSLAKDEALESIARANRYVLERHQTALQALLNDPVQLQGHTDLTVRGRKFSGNSQRRRRRFLLFHGTFLLQFDLSRVEALLPMPSRQPAYRADRAHRDFLTNLQLPAATLKTALSRAWGASETMVPPPAGTLEALVREKYGQTAWNFRL
jgi:lipoate-protein ligase A